MSNMTNYLEGEIRKALFRASTWAARANSQAYALGDRIYAAAFDGNIYECITAGISAAAPPTFNTNLGDTTVDGTVTWLTLKMGLPKRPIYVGLVRATLGYSSAIRSTAVTVGATVIPAAPNKRLYRCTTAGTTGASEPAWTTVEGGTVIDGTAVWTEMTPDLDAMNANVTEVAGGSYVRAQRDPADANWSAPDATGGLTDNVAAIAFPAPTANWGVIFGFFIADRAAGIDRCSFASALIAPKTVNNGDPAPSFAAGALDIFFN